MAAVTLLEAPGERRLLYALTVEKYHRMIESGILPEGEPFELLEGQVVRKERNAQGEDPMTVGPAHSEAVTALSFLNAKLRKQSCHIRTQQPITIPPYSEPEPDGAIVTGSKRDYRKRHPGPSDVLCVIEVADATLQHDRKNKIRVYAKAGIAQYIIINLVNRELEVYTRPNRRKGAYSQSTTLDRGQTVVFPTTQGDGLTVPVRRLIPPA